jgi:hypothetical protein
MNNSPQCALCIGYKETLVEGTVNMKFLGLQIDDHHKQKNHIDQMISKLNGDHCVVGSVFSVPYQQHDHSKSHFAYFYSVIKYRIFSGGHSSNSGKIFALHKKIVRIAVGVKPSSACLLLLQSALKPLAGRFYRVPLPAARQPPNLEENQGFRAIQLSPQEAPSV